MIDVEQSCRLFNAPTFIAFLQVACAVGRFVEVAASHYSHASAAKSQKGQVSDVF